METMPARRQPPTIALRRLASELLAMRGARSRDQVKVDIGLSEAALLRIEKAKVRPQVRTLRQLLDYYGADAAKKEELEELLKRSRELQWLQRYEEYLPQSYQNFIAFEADAIQMSDYQSLLMPGLLQTRGYAEVVSRALLPEVDDEGIAQRVDARMRRQDVLEKASFWAILDEAAIRRILGDGDVYRQQLRYLAEASRRPNVTLQVIPFTAGPHLGMTGNFITMDFSAPAAPLVYTENAEGGLFLEADEDVRRYRATFQRLAAQAASPEDTLKIIESAASTT